MENDGHENENDSDQDTPVAEAGKAIEATGDEQVEADGSEQQKSDAEAFNPQDLNAEDFSAPPVLAEALIVDVDGFEGPLDVLLMLARSQKVDLKKISIVALVDQYMEFVAAAKRLNLELAADYLVMASWLAYLKSKLILPAPEEENSDELSGEEMAARLQFRLQRLHAMREAGARLMARNRLGRDVFSRGAPEGIRIVRKAQYEADLFELLKAYTSQRVRTISKDDLKIKKLPVFAIELARKRIENMFGRLKDWNSMDSLLPKEWITDPAIEAQGDEKWKSARASTFLACLELVKEEHLDIRQLSEFGPIYVRSRSEMMQPLTSADDV